MRKFLPILGVLGLVLLAGCVTINVYFPKAAAEKAADQFIGSVIGPENDTSAPASDQKPATQPTRTPSSGPAAGPNLGSRVLDFLIPAAHAAEPDLRIHSPAVDAIHQRMRERYRAHLHQWLDAGVVGFTADGLLAVHDASVVPLSQRAAINTTVATANRDRVALYREIANANGHPDWEGKIRGIFAQLWIEKAHKGWYYRTSAGTWKRK